MVQPMEVFLRDIPAEGIDLTFEADPSHLQLVEEGIGFEGLVHVQLSISKQQDTVYLTGHIEAELVLDCSLCLKKLPYPLSLGMQAEYLSTRFLSAREEHELKPEELDVIFYSRDAIQFDDLVREQILLAIPMHPLCAPVCRGLCPRCGQDLNVGQCRCTRTEPDVNFSVLKNYFKDHRR